MISKTTYQSYFNNPSNETCLIWGLGAEPRNSFDVLKMWAQKMGDSKLIAFVPQNKLEKFLKEMDSVSFTVDDSILVGVDENGKLNDVQLKRFVEYIDTQNSECEFVVDVTGISRENLLIILHFLRTSNKSNVKIVYISCEYGKYQIIDYRTPQNNKFFEGRLSLGKPTAMIILAGYEKMACEVLINTYQPNKLFIGFSQDSIEKGQNLPERVSVDELVQNYMGKVDMTVYEFEYKVNDFLTTYESLCKLVVDNDLKNKYNIIIASCTSKLATVGMYLFHEKFPEAQYVYTTGTPKDLSRGIINVYESRLP